MTLVAHEQLTMVTLGSGSKGNATWIGTAGRGVLIDCGISTKQILARLEAAGLGGAPIDAVLITHEHTDHVGSCGVLDRKLFKQTGRHIPFLMTEGTYRNIPASRRPDNVAFVAPGIPVPWHGWALQPHTVPHDTPAPVAWTVQVGEVRAGVITDLGCAPKMVAHLLSTLDMAVVEFNHDEQMLRDGDYPEPLKQRIASSHGHLSNRQAAQLVKAGTSRRLRHLVLAHLSEENNQPQHALEAAAASLREADMGHVTVHLGEQRTPVGPFRVGSSVHAVGQPSLFDARP